MPLYRDIRFHNGVISDIKGATSTNTGVVLLDKEKGMSARVGLGQYLNFNAQLLPENAFSVVVWAKLKESHVLGTSRGIIIGSSSDNSGSSIHISYTGNGGESIILLNNSYLSFRYFNYIPNKKWHCYIFTIPGSAQNDINSAALKVDNVSIAVTSTTSSGAQIARSGFTYVGGSNNASGGVYIARIKVYDHVLSDKEQTNEYLEYLNFKPQFATKQISYPKPTYLNESGLVAAYNMQKVGNVLVDISGNGKNGTITGGVIQTKEGLKLNGVNGKITFGNIGNVKSILLRAKFSTTSQIIMEKASNSGLIYNSSGTLTAADFATKYVNTIGTVMQAGQWMTMALTSSSNVSFSTATLGLNNTTYGNFEISDLRFYSTELTSAQIQLYHNQFAKRISLKEDFSDLKTDGSNIVPKGWQKVSGAYKGSVLTSEDSVLKHLKKGTKYLQCTTAGVFAIPSKQAYGTWEFDVYKGADANQIYINFISSGRQSPLYQFYIYTDERIYFERIGGSSRFYSAISYISIKTWYRIKITRTTAGMFTLYIKGGAFGTNWTLVSTSGGSGTNPVTDTTYTTSNYFVVDLDQGDRIANISIKEGIEITSEPKIILDSLDLGTAGAILRFQSSSNTTMWLEGDANFYNDSNYNTGTTQVKTITADSLQTFYVKMTGASKSARLRFENYSLITKWGDSLNDGFTEVANSFKITLNAFPFVNLTQLRIKGAWTYSGALPTGVTILHLIGNSINWTYSGALPTGLTYLQLYGNLINWTYSGALPTGLTYLYLYGNSINWTYSGALPTGLTVLYLSGSSINWTYGQMELQLL